MERSSISKGIWLCATCARRIDVDSRKFPRELLLEWKQEAEDEADQQLGRPRSMLSAEQDEPQVATFVCPHCHTGFSRGQTVCKGCHGQIVEGATEDERKTALTIGIMAVLMSLLFVYSKFDIKLLQVDKGVIGYIPLFFLGLSSVLAGAYMVSLEEKRRRKANPRVFVRTYV
jgi:hypothetical protein